MNILITGASKGLGFELSKNMLERNQHVIAVARSKELLENLRQDVGKIEGKLTILPGDLTHQDFRSEIVAKAKDLGGIDILVNNAGLLINKKVEDFTREDFDSLFNINVKSAFFLTQSLIPLFNKAAHVLNISSMGGYQGSLKFPGLSLYSAAKAALAVLTESLAEELKEYSVRVNCLALGAVQTEMLAKAFPGYKAPVTAGEMADFVADFALKAPGFINGKIIPVSLSTP